MQSLSVPICPDPRRAPPRAGSLSPALCQLINAALIDPSFGDELLAEPARAAEQAAHGLPGVLGCTLPDPALRLPAIAFDADDWSTLGQLAPSESLRGLCSSLRAMASNGSAADAAADTLVARFTSAADRRGQPAAA